MKIHFLGTAASEGFPNVFCSCDACLQARKQGGRNIRSRSSVLIDEGVKIDASADSQQQALREGIDLGKVNHLLITHTHYDHLYAGDLTSRMKGFAHGVASPLHIYGNALALRYCKEYDLHTIGNGEEFKLHHIHPFTPFQFEQMTVTPLVADHDPDELCLLFYIEKNGKKLLYGNDTGWFPNETWEWLENKKIDAAILDCTVGVTGNKRSSNHMSVETVIDMKKTFEEKDMLTENGQVIATHFSHNCGLLYEDLVTIFEPYDIKVAYDGMIENI